MDKVGIIKEFDKLGRIVIPKDLRERFALDNKVEIIATKEGVLILFRSVLPSLQPSFLSRRLLL